jgi:hypothetical protein
MSACCNPANAQKTTRATRRTREFMTWLLPSVALVFAPKCPACVAAYVALWTGLGMSFTAATYVRWFWLSLCIGSLLFLVVTRVKSRFANHCNFKKAEIEP